MVRALGGGKGRDLRERWISISFVDCPREKAVIYLYVLQSPFPWPFAQDGFLLDKEFAHELSPYGKSRDRLGSFDESAFKGY